MLFDHETSDVRVPMGFAIAVVIPARDEATHIASTVTSVQAALRAAPVASSCIVVVADACTDDTADVARRHLGPSDAVLEVDHRCVGEARAIGSSVALSLSSSGPRWTWVLGIDADSVAPRSWVRRHLAHATRGVECVTGIVELEPLAPHSVRQQFASTYQLGIRKRSHDHVHGTNFGIRGDTLLAAGNWPPESTAEDHGLWRAVTAMGRRTIQDPAIVVSTSARLVGRAPLGFAGDLADIDAQVSCDASSE